MLSAIKWQVHPTLRREEPPSDFCISQKSSSILSRFDWPAARRAYRIMEEKQSLCGRALAQKILHRIPSFRFRERGIKESTRIYPIHGIMKVLVLPS
jgi:hypothetical protein